MMKTKTTVKGSSFTPQDRAGSDRGQKQVAPISDLQIRALGQWNKQLGEGLITRRNGYASYSLMKMLLSRNIMT